MTEEEKEAIAQLKSWREFIIKNKEKVNKANDLEFYLRTTLNLIQKQQEEIKLLKEQEEYVINEYGRTIEEKDKMIDLIVKQLTKLRENSEEDCFIPRSVMNINDCTKTTCEDCIKQYFERKVEDKEC